MEYVNSRIRVTEEIEPPQIVLIPPYKPRPTKMIWNIWVMVVCCCKCLLFNPNALLCCLRIPFDAHYEIFCLKNLKKNPCCLCLSDTICWTYIILIQLGGTVLRIIWDKFKTILYLEKSKLIKKTLKLWISWY